MEVVDDATVTAKQIYENSIKFMAQLQDAMKRDELEFYKHRWDDADVYEDARGKKWILAEDDWPEMQTEKRTPYACPACNVTMLRKGGINMRSYYRHGYCARCESEWAILLNKYGEENLEKLVSRFRSKVPGR